MGILAVLALCVLAGTATSTASKRTQGTSPTVLFSDGNRDDHNRSWGCVRGPAIVRSAKGSLMAFSGGGTSCADGHVGFAVLVRISRDNGASWSNITYVGGDDGTTGGYIAPIVDNNTGAVLVLYNRAFSETWIAKSVDDGYSWSTPVNITNAIGGPMAVGPPGGVQLASGRLVLAAHGANGTYAIMSDDGGVTWKHGTPVVFATGVTNGGESQIIADHRSSNSLSFVIRVGSTNVLLNHAIAESNDGGETWTVAQIVVGATGPTCEGSIARRPGGGLLLSLPNWPHWHSPADRRNMTVFGLSRNSTNQSMPTYSVDSTVQIWSGPSAYSAMTADGDFVLFEGGTTYRYASVMIAPVQIVSRSQKSQ